MNQKFIFVVGGVYSGIGKGISTASIALLMKQRGHEVNCIKFDPYLNTSASCLSPAEHGEVMITDDGSEMDLDIGHYYRIAAIDISAKNICTNGSLHKELIEEEEQGLYLGQTIQTNQHVAPKIISKLKEMKEDIILAEIGGTVDDIESYPFLEAIRQFKQIVPNDIIVIMVSPILWIPTIKEFKTKPLQNSIKELQRHGIQADVLLCRSTKSVPDKILEKVKRLTGIETIFPAPDVECIYQVPIEFYNRHIDDFIADKFHLKRTGCRIHKYRDLVEKYVNGSELPVVNIGIVGKYTNCDEAYISLKEALYHAGVNNSVRIKIKWINAEELEESKDARSFWRLFEDIHGVIVPGGFDSRGVEGKIRAIQYVREKKMPFLGICLGLQCAVIEFARNVCNLEDANSIEFDASCDNPVIDFVLGQENIRKKSGTMRLGAYDCEIDKETIAHELYKKKTISERHRHRYEVQAEKYLELYEKEGMIVSGRNPESNLVEIMELNREVHPYFICTQAHPEFKSRLGSPAPLFDGLVKYAYKGCEKESI